MSSISENLKKLMVELKQGVQDCKDILVEGETGAYNPETVDPLTMSLSRAYLQGSIDAAVFVIKRLASFILKTKTEEQSDRADKTVLNRNSKK